MTSLADDRIFYHEEDFIIKRSLSRFVGLIDGDSITAHVNRLPAVKTRAAKVRSLIRSTVISVNKRLKALSEKCECPSSLRVTSIRPHMASEADLLTFHSSAFVSWLKERVQDTEESNEEIEEYGMQYDCPILHDMYGLVTSIAGSSITAARALYTVYDRQKQDSSKPSPVCLNWYGGWHHAQRDQAAGFCYVNDVVLAISALKRHFERVLYVDLDVHHGDGVESAFAFTKNVFTLSFHLLEAGFFPGTGKPQDQGMGRGKLYAMNVPFKCGLCDSEYFDVFAQAASGVVDSFKPSAIVIQCGADALATDPNGGLSLTDEAYLAAIDKLVSLNVPTLLLGGGGYSPENAAKLWTLVTLGIAQGVLGTDSAYSRSLFGGQDSGENTRAFIPQDIPEDDPHFLHYGPDYSFQLPRGRRRNENSRDEIEPLFDMLSNLL